MTVPASDMNGCATQARLGNPHRTSQSASPRRPPSPGAPFARHHDAVAKRVRQGCQ